MSAPITPPQPSAKFALYGLFAGGLAMVTGLILSILYAFTVWKNVGKHDGSAASHAEVADMELYFKAMNRMMTLSVLVSVFGMIIVVICAISLSRRRKKS